MYWYPLPMQTHPQHQPPSQGQHLPPMPMSPRNPSANLPPSTPTLPHTAPTPIHAPIPPQPLSHQSASLGGLAPSPSTPSATPKTLNAASSSFVPRKAITVSLKTPDGVEVDLENRRTVSTSNTPSTIRQGSPGTSNRKSAGIRIESEDQRKQRLAEEGQKARVKAEAEERERKEKEFKLREEEERKRKEAEAEKERIQKAEEEGRLKKEEEERKKREEEERKKIEEEKRLRREEEEREAQRIQEEEERRHRQEEEERRAAEEKAKKEEEERLQREKEERERVEREQADHERLARETEEKRLAEEAEKKAAEALAQTPDGRDMEDGEIFEDQDTPPPDQDGKEKVRETLRIDTTTPAIGRRRHPGPLDLEEAKKSNIAGPQSALATARIISDIHSVPYPDGVSSPNPALNQNAKEGKFRCVTEYDELILLLTLSFIDTTEISSYNSCRSVRRSLFRYPLLMRLASNPSTRHPFT